MTYKTCIKVPGTPVSVTGQTMHQIGVNTWQVSDVARRVLSDNNPRIKVGVANADPADYELSLLTGTVTFSANAPAISSAVNFVGDYLPMAHVGGANKYTLSGESSTEDVTAFEDIDPDELPADAVPARVYAVGSSDVKATFERIIRENKALYLKAMLSRETVLLYMVADNGDVTVGRFNATSDNFNGANQISRDNVTFVLSGDLEYIFVNLAIQGYPSADAIIDTPYNFQPEVTGSEGTLIFSVANAPAWLTIDADTGLLSGTPVTGDEGTTNNIIITVTQGADSADLAPFDLTVA